MLVPPSVLIGFRERSRFIYNDPSTGVIRVVEQPYLTQEEVGKFMMKQMQPIHYLAPNAKPIVTPRYVLKILESNGSTSISIYYCH